MPNSQIVCPYCGKGAEMVTGKTIYPSISNLHHKNFYICFPCDAYVGCHDAGSYRYERGFKILHNGTEPLGRLANSELRKAKTEAHAAFDPLWKNSGLNRKVAYRKLAERLNIDVEECHIGMFDVETCKKVVDICKNWF